MHSMKKEEEEEESQNQQGPVWVLYVHHYKIIHNTKIPGNQVTIDGEERERGMEEGVREEREEGQIQPGPV